MEGVLRMREENEKISQEGIEIVRNLRERTVLFNKKRAFQTYDVIGPTKHILRKTPVLY